VKLLHDMIVLNFIHLVLMTFFAIYVILIFDCSISPHQKFSLSSATAYGSIILCGFILDHGDPGESREVLHSS
jgi:hypothetical protein